MTPREVRDLIPWMVGGLAIGTLGNLAVIWLLISCGSYAFAGNAAAVIVCPTVAVVVWRKRHTFDENEVRSSTAREDTAGGLSNRNEGER